MPKPVVHPATQKLLSAFARDPAHALCLSGEPGVGLSTIAHDIAAELSKASTITTITPDEKSLIPIEVVQNLYKQTRGVQQDKRFIVVDDADSMSLPAQNALLKLLEEPVKNVHFILTTHKPGQLLATIRSRSQVISVLPLDDTASKKILAGYNLTPTQLAQAMFLAAGRPAELTRLATDQAYFANKTTLVTDARSFLQADGYTRLTLAKKYTDRPAALAFLAMTAKLLNFMLLKQKNYQSAAMMDLLDDTMARLEANGHVRTQLMYLVTKLP